MIHVTHHAMQRFSERVSPCTMEEARARILGHSKAIHAAAAFNCSVVRCGDGERLILDGLRVLTVYAARNFPRQCRSPFGRGGEV